MRRLLILVILLFSILALRSLSSSASPQQTESKQPDQRSKSAQGQTNPDQRGTENAPLVIKILQTDHAQNEAKSQTEAQIHNTNESWGLSDKIAAWAVIMALLQFLALLFTVGVMIRSSRRQLRAYILPESGGVVEGNMCTPPVPAKANIPGAGLFIKNSGQTPAYKVVSWMQIAVIPITQESTALVVPPIEQRFPNTIGSSGMFNKLLWFDRSLTPSEISDIIAGTRAIYLYGRIEYVDAFKKKHFTNFRLRYNGQFPPPQNTILNFAENGNDAD